METTAARRPLWRRLIALVDPAEPGFLARMARAGCALGLLVACVVCGLLAAVSQLPLGRYLSAAILLETRQIGPAERLAQDLVRRHPGELVSYYELLAAVYRRTGRQDEQLAVWDQAVQDMPSSWSAHSQRCWFGSLFGDPRAVAVACDRGVALASEREGMAHARRALNRLLLDDRDGARADLTEALSRWQAHGGAPRWIVRSRQRWLNTLEAGGDPLDERTLRFERNRF